MPASLSGLSARLAEIVDALPLLPGMRVLEIGSAPGTAAKEVAKRAPPSGHVLVTDRSAKGVTLTERNAAAEIAGRLMSVRHVAVEEFLLLPDERPFDRAFAVRVGALDGRHPGNGVLARSRIAAALVPGGRLLIDGGNPLREIDLQPDRP